MKHTTTGLHQILKFIPRTQFNRLVERHRGDHRVRRFSCWNQLTVMLFSQLVGSCSLRETVEQINSQGTAHDHLGLRPLRRSTLSDANAKRPTQIWQELFYSLLSEIKGRWGQQGTQMIRLIDSTTIDLNLHHFQWAHFRSTKAGIKLHTVFDPEANVPTFFELTEAKTNDRQAANALPLLNGATYVFDRAYDDYAWYAQLDRRNIRFVGRMKRHACYEVIRSHRSRHPDVLDDQVIQLSSPTGRKHCPIPLRRIRLRRATDNRVLVFLSNDLERSAETIAGLYKQRWQIELFFKWIKQNLKIKRFIGTSKNAVMTQVLIALIAYLLLRLAQLRDDSQKSLLQWARWVRVNLMHRRDLRAINEPPPDPDMWKMRRETSQLEMAFG